MLEFLADDQKEVLVLLELSRSIIILRSAKIFPKLGRL